MGRIILNVPPFCMFDLWDIPSTGKCDLGVFISPLVLKLRPTLSSIIIIHDAPFLLCWNSSFYSKKRAMHDDLSLYEVEKINSHLHRT